MKTMVPALVCASVLLTPLSSHAQAPATVEYRVLATNKTATMQKEMQQAAEAGFRFGGVMGGDTAFGGSEVVVIMVRDGSPGGYDYRGQTVFKSTFGGKEVVAILEKAPDAKIVRYEYRLLATKKTSTCRRSSGRPANRASGSSA